MAYYSRHSIFLYDNDKQKLLYSRLGCRATTAMQTLSLQEKVNLFRSLFKGREDVFARRWYSKATGKAGYQPVCQNEWNRQLCDKRKFKCAECPNRQFAALTDKDIYRHLEGKANYLSYWKKYEYEPKSLTSTRTFIQVINRLRLLNPQMKAQIFFVPYKVDARMGTHEEQELWHQMDEEFNKSGIVAPPVGYRAQMKRVNTYNVPLPLKHAVYESFRFIVKSILR